ncbi:tetratricopeptide repeat protein [Paenibacillus lemnae]|uniref:Tetratricopeptide repeat protein n=1 Tax=Paenibacillus lemnae TaxID=1330551 RepID=A0A848M221_PAELE|nr:tetratricopeptide repeat protein [Paenibacillus lemnae]NMO94301.1 tetratricopeptide repeat protein [Paenibacillus lemnae]
MTDQHKQQQSYRFSEAPLWKIQQEYYEEKGMKAWDNDQVPQYITSNPMIAAAYADMIFGFLQDRVNQEGSSDEPVYIVELGAGAGRFAYHVIQELCQLRDLAGSSLPPFRYIMTDYAMSNVKAWREHPALQPLVAEGLLDFARFDAVTDTSLSLVESGTTIKPGDLKQPLLVIANYLFDSLPQELMYIGDGQTYEADVFVEYPADKDALNRTEVLNGISLSYEYRRTPHYEQENYPYRDVVALYQEQLEDSHVLFPEVGLGCLERLNDLSQSGFLLITADKGDHLLENWKFNDPPELIIHGSFSLTANFHAFQHVYERKGALVLFPPHHYKNINVGCILHVDHAQDYLQVKLAYRRAVERFGPDEFYSLKEWVDRHLESMGMQQLLSFWRLGGYDAEFFIYGTARISSLLPEANDEERQDLWRGIQLMWASNYVMEQRYDLALDIGLLLFEMDLYKESKRFLEISVKQNEDEVVSTVFYCLAICCFELEWNEEGLEYIRKLLQLEPDNEEALALLNEFY